MAEAKHYLEVGSDDVPRRARPEQITGADDSQAQSVSPPSVATHTGATQAKSAGATTTKTAGAKSSPADDVKFGYDHTKAFVGIDYKGDRNESEWRSVGERMGGLIWRLLFFVAIIGWFIYQAVTCDRAPIYIINP